MPSSRINNVPKFSSFKPNLTTPASSKSEGHLNSNARNDPTGHQQGERGQKNPNFEETYAQKNGVHRIACGPIAAIQICQDNKLRDQFVSDWNGDEKNLVYGSLHKYSVPKYHRYGAGRVLGAPSESKIDRENVDEKCIILTDVRLPRRFTKERYIFSKINHKIPTYVKPGSEATEKLQEYSESNFLPFKLHGNDRAPRQEGEFQDDEKDVMSKFEKTITCDLTERYDDITSKLENKSHDMESEADRIDTSAREKNVMLCRQVEDNPHDIEAWLSLINHQDCLIQQSGDRYRVTQAMLRSTSDIKIHMYEKALSKSNSLDNRERLLCGLMTEGEKIWELKAQASRWEKISKENIYSLVLWTKYLNFKQTTFSEFRFEELKGLYLQRIKFLSQALHTQPENSDRLMHGLLYVLLRATIFMREAGYAELATAIWQSNLEINFCGAQENTMGSDCLNLFKEFWESEIPRIGEDGAKGWLQYLKNPDESVVLDPIVDEPPEILDKHKLFERWAAAERMRSRVSRIPAKTMDEVAEDDPFRVILYSDVEEFLVLIPVESKKLRYSCINAFLAFCGMQPLVNLDDSPPDYWDDPFIIGDLSEADCGLKRSVLANNSQEHDDLAPWLSLTAYSHFVSSPESIFRGVIASKDDSLAEYYLSFKFYNDPLQTRKLARDLLKQSPSSLRLYHAYALIEWSKANKDTADKVFETAINMKNYTTTKSDDLSIMLWRSWIWAHLEDRNNTKSLQCLLCIADGVPDTSISISPALFLRTKQYLIANRDNFFETPTLSVMYTEYWLGLAILEYLSNSPGQAQSLDLPRNIAGALTAYSSAAQVLLERQQIKAHELLLQSAARLLYHYSQSGPYRPALIREQLTNFIQFFPRNTIFLAFYSWNESRLRIDNRVRNILLHTSLLSKHDNITSRIFSIRHELRIGTIHSVKAAFENAISSTASKSSVGLWRLYIIYCAHQEQLRTQIKSLWHRALRACPWAKELYILGFELMRGMVKFPELKDTWKVMEEKELRVHIYLDDQLEEIETKRQEDLSSKK
ncbi:hypothetical protein BGHDH14_bgh04859 [Blumeria hordei DH14]|uniref:DUF1740-domain-containing protein n=1 Tax=Blumeria graminis f. sp. hordei (strain DH14) TaxID=546991 RepID=N1J8M1_BLUG1|nr:hypothetical protein BGHDH14_bgh04859 [Blumeria hordei DH14]